MKKFFMIAVMAVAAISASAQKYYVGGTASFNSDKQGDDSKAINTITIAPEFGYNLNDQWSIGAKIDYTSVSCDGTSESTFGFGAYARYAALKINNFTLFLDGGIDYKELKDMSVDALKEKKHDEDEESTATPSQFFIGVQPGIKYSLNKKFDLVAKVGKVGYTSRNNKAGSAFDIKADFANIQFGLYYNF